MLLFEGETLMQSNIIGAVRAGSETLLNFSNKPNFNVGGPALIRAVRQSEFETNRAQARVDHSAFVVYGQNRRSTTTIVSVTDGDFRYIVSNRNPRLSLEIRANGWTGERIAFLGRGQINHVIQTTSSDEIGLFPVWIGFNSRTHTMVTFEPLDIPLSAVPVFPRPQGHPEVPNIYFPRDGSNQIDFPISFPTAVIRVANNTGIGATFRNANQRIRSESGFPGMNSGGIDSFEIEATGIGFNLNVLVGLVTDNIVVPVRFADAPGAGSVSLQNGYFYTVEINHLPGQPAHLPSSYTAILVQQHPLDPTDVIIAF
jgi:hypothetical protein